jgi:S-methylmethionine-dependent homocysteine/selenocysteine methylase
MRIIDELPATPHSRYEAVRRALAAQRCVILDGRPADDPATWTRMLVEAPDEVRYLHRRFVDAGCDVITTGTSLGAARSLDAHWMELARRGVRLAREAAGAGGDRDSVVAVVPALPPGALRRPRSTLGRPRGG